MRGGQDTKAFGWWQRKAPAATKMRPAVKSVSHKCASLSDTNSWGFRAPTACDHVEFPLVVIVPLLHRCSCRNPVQALLL